MTPLFALVDGNSFFCSCELVFEPQFRDKPVIVLSNNDGCVVSRTAAAKALGIAMAVPYFQIRELCRRAGVLVFSSNFALYGDMSRRMNDVYRQFTPRVEVYSIDESFLDFSDAALVDCQTQGHEIRRRVQQWTGIPTCVGWGPTKTLAKLANWTAKRYPRFGGVCDYTDRGLREEMMPRIPVAELWGVGRSSAEKLGALGIRSVADLRDAEPKKIRRALSVTGERMVLELRGSSCLPLDHLPFDPKGCAVTRSFGKAIVDVGEMRSALVGYATRAAEKLRRKRMAAKAVTVFMHTNRFNRDPWRSASKTCVLPEPSSDTRVLVGAALEGVERIWKSGFRYSKAGIVLSDLSSRRFNQLSLLEGEEAAKSERLMRAWDQVNQKWGRNAVRLAEARDRNPWGVKDLRSPRYTTEFGELPVAAANADVVLI